ncbi:hypothetical protein [Sulfurimonas sp. HSL3-7]|uniref:hypothetical protein n=1 Tax=Sulfonitrofixus jiaomeiensis TaxID=3131938 RepID=UPI0031F730A4
MSKELVLSNNEAKAFSEAFEYAKKWCSDNQWAVGVAEMAVGASLVAWGVHNGVIEMGSQLVATELGGSNIESMAGAAGGSGIGAVAGSIVGSIGVVGMGGAIGIPAALVIGGAAVVLGMAGYTAGDVAHNATNAINTNTLAANGSVLLVGVALIIDGARRCIKDPKVLSALSLFKEKVVILNDLSSKIIAQSMGELQGFIEELKKLPEDIIEASVGTGSAALGAGLGASAGGAVAAGSVTLLGSQALGGAAVSLGLVSAPIWPIVAGIAGGAGIGYVAYKAIKYWKEKPDLESS